LKLFHPQLGHLHSGSQGHGGTGAIALEPAAGKPLALRGSADMFGIPGSDKGAKPLFIPLHEDTSLRITHTT
jgi:hypothetical protein